MASHTGRGGQRSRVACKRRRFGMYTNDWRLMSGVGNLGIDATNATGRWNSIYLQNAPNVVSLI